MRRLLVACVLALVMGARAQAQVPSDVPPNHWAYQAVQDLASKGLVLGYPDGKFLGNRTLTRYEMATLIKRVLDYLAQMPGTRGPAGAPGPPGPAGAGGVNPQELAEIRRLVEEFRTELTVIGTDMKAAKERMDALEEKVNSLEEIIKDPEGKLETVVSQVTALRRVLFSGYVQARYESFENSKDDTGTVDRFTVRRARLVTSARPANAVGVRLQIDAAGSSGNPPTSQPAGTTVQLKDAWIDWYPWQDPLAGPTFTIGQMKWPFGFEVTQSSGVRETPERANFSLRLFPNERDRGAKIASTAGKPLFWEVGAYNGTGINTNDNNNNKDVVGRIRYSFGQLLDLGLSGYFGEAFEPSVRNAAGVVTTPARSFVKNRYGTDFQLFFPGIQLRGEFVQGRGQTLVGPGAPLGRNPRGWDAELNYNLGTKNVLVAKYDWFDEDIDDPARPGKISAWNLGIIRYLDPVLRLKLFYQINDEQRNEVDNNLFTAEFIANF
jgi:Phosphate-selective porin O and P/S-layer homology domain